MVPDCKTFERRPESSAYKMGSSGSKVTNGDSIGVLLEFDHTGTARVNFYKNGELLDKEFKNIKAGKYYPCLSINHGKNVVVLNSKANIPQGLLPKSKKEEVPKSM